MKSEVVGAGFPVFCPWIVGAVARPVLHSGEAALRLRTFRVGGDGVGSATRVKAQEAAPPAVGPRGVETKMNLDATAWA